MGLHTAPEFAPARVNVERLPGGGVILRSPAKLEAYPASICSFLLDWAEQTPDRPFLAERCASGAWRNINYQDALTAVRAIAQALLSHGVTVDRPVMILSGNSIESGLLQLAAMFVGLPVSPMSPAYSMISRDFGKLRFVFDLLKPKLVFASNAELFGDALSALDLDDVTLVVKQGTAKGLKPGPKSPLRSLTIDEFLATKSTAEVDAAYAAVGPDTVAKILFTSGSTGMPKGVINTQRMLCANQQVLAQMWPFLAARPPVLVDWLPWNHTFGGNHNFNMILRNGGTLYIDGGKPAPGIFDTTLENLRDIAPTAYFNVPRGFQMLAPYLEQNAEFRDHFFSNLDTIFYAASALPQDLWERFGKLSLATLGKKIAMTSGYGLTESAPLAVGVHFPIAQARVIGLPVAGTEVKMLPNAGKLELRLRGPNITPGYFRRDDLTRDAFDEDGFYKTGDAGKFADANDPASGIVFDGRVAEDFKLLTGTWVNTGMVRITAISTCAGIVQDAVITGHDRDNIGLLVIPNAAGIAELAGLSGDLPVQDLLSNGKLWEKVRRKLRHDFTAYNTHNQASSRRIARIVLLTEPLDIDAGEVTDKGYINQRAVLERRSAIVERLYSEAPEVINL